MNEKMTSQHNLNEIKLVPYNKPQSFGLPESLFLDKNSNQSIFLNKNSNQIDLLILNLIIFILYDGSSIGWVAVAVADAGGVDGRFCCGGGSIGHGGGGCGGGGAAVWDGSLVEG